MAEEGSETLLLSIKTTKEKIEAKVPADYTVKQLKEHLAKERSEFVVGQQCLIFAGRILKDEETLESQGVKSGVTVHLVIRSGKPQSSSTPARANTGVSQSQPSASGMGMGLGGMGMGMGGGDMQAQLVQVQQQLMSNPELMRQLMESPLMQSMMANPDALQSMLTSNPQIQQLMERNPELTHVLHNPELMRQAMEMARNPAAMREMMRSQDRQLSNIESIPGGFNALARMYHEIQEPMMDAAQESIQQQLQSNPFNALFNQQQATPNPGPTVPQGTPNTAPLPNPWAGSSSGRRTTGASSSGTRATTTTATSTATTTSSSSSSSSSSSNSANVPSVGAGGLPSMNEMGALGIDPQQVMEQMMTNPEMMQQAMQMYGQGGAMADPQMVAQMMQNPVYQQMMQQVMSNPQVMEQMLRNHPLFANNPQVGELSRQYAQMMQQGELQQMMSNPEALSAMMQIQQGMMRLQNTAPGMMTSGFGMGGTPASSQPPVAPPTNSAPTSTTSPLTQEMLQQMISQVMAGSGPAQQPPGGVAAGGRSTQPPPATAPGGSLSRQQQAEVLYQAQLEQLAAMGFNDRQRNLRALIESGGDINAAVNRLIQ